MESQPLFLDFLIAGKMTDFQIRSQGYVFNVHRVILSSSSRYFEKVCSGSFKEAIDGFVNSEENPNYLAALILGIYAGTYLNDHRDYLVKYGRLILENAYKGGTPSAHYLYDFDEKPATLFHAKMFQLSEYYQCDSLRNHAKLQYLKAIHDPINFTISSLLEAIIVLYSICQTVDESLRGPTVYMAQRIETSLHEHPTFKLLIQDSDFADFVWDFTTKYHRANYVYCPECRCKVELAQCKCGFEGLCGYRYCTTQDFSQMTCTMCQRTGHLIKNAPGLGDAGTTDEDKVGTVTVGSVMPAGGFRDWTKEAEDQNDSGSVVCKKGKKVTTGSPGGGKRRRNS